MVLLQTQTGEYMSKGVFFSAGGGNEIGGSRYIYVIDGIKIGFDCGFRPLRSQSDVTPLLLKNKSLRNLIEEASVRPLKKQLPDLESFSDVEHLILTHGHLDHIGAVPLLTRKHRYLKVYGTSATKDICELQWFETIKIADRNKEIPIFTKSDAEHALSRFEIIHPDQQVHINDKISFVPVDAGHILGSVSVVILYRGEAIGFHSGDMFCGHTVNSPQDSKLLANGLAFMTVDSTRLTEENVPREEVEEECVNMIRKAIENGQSVRFLTFAIDRAQKAYTLSRRACPDAKIWIDGQAKQASEIYSRYKNGALAGIKDCFIQGRSHRSQVIESREPNIAIVSSAMCFGGNSRNYIVEDCADKNRLYINLGWLDSCSPEYAFFESQKGDVFRFGEHDRPRYCDVARFNLTAHCDGEDILAKKDEFNADKVILVHGDDSRMDQFITEHPDEGFVKGVNGIEIEF